MSCFQCDLEIPHVCYAGMPNARWGWGDEAMAVLEGAQRHGYMLTPEQQRQRQRREPQRRPASKKRKVR